MCNCWELTEQINIRSTSKLCTQEKLIRYGEQKAESTIGKKQFSVCILNKNNYAGDPNNLKEYFAKITYGPHSCMRVFWHIWDQSQQRKKTNLHTLGV